VAEYLGVSEERLAKWRSESRGPSFVKLEGKIVRYRAADVEEWISTHIHQTGG
jgi:predicted DNA-binding transcriptional regulator AlpA